MIEIKEISRSFGGVVALSHVNFSVEKEAIHGLIGPNGSGKTTLLNIISGIDSPDYGEVVFDGKSISGLEPHKVSAEGIARTYQNIRLFENLTVEENLVVGRYKHLKGFFRRLARSYAKKTYLDEDDQQLLNDYLRWVGVYELRNRLASETSLAERRKIEIGRALCSEPKLLLLDEPGAGMHPGEKKEISDLIHAIREKGITVLLVDHDMEIIMSICDSITVLNFGKVIATGSADAIRKDPIVVKAYLGDEYAQGS